MGFSNSTHGKLYSVRMMHIIRTWILHDLLKQNGSQFGNWIEHRVAGNFQKPNPSVSKQGPKDLGPNFYEHQVVYHILFGFIIALIEYDISPAYYSRGSFLKSSFQITSVVDQAVINLLRLSV